MADALRELGGTPAPPAAAGAPADCAAALTDMRSETLDPGESVAPPTEEAGGACVGSGGQEGEGDSPLTAAGSGGSLESQSHAPA